MPGVTVDPRLQKAITGSQSALDPANASVLDPWYVRWAREAARMVGAGDPTQVPIMPNVSAFMARGVPQVAARSAATKSALSQLEAALVGHIPDAEINQVLTTAGKYPRVMAHVNSIQMRPELNVATASADGGRQLMGAVGTNEMAYGPLGFGAKPAMSDIKLAYKDNPEISKTFFHELGHAAQRVGKKSDVMDAYREMNNAVGYANNPFELSAESIGRRKTLHPEEAPVTIANSTPLMRAIMQLQRIMPQGPK